MAIDVFRKWGPFAGAILFAAAIFINAFFVARVFSITIWYNLAYALVSVSLFGLAFGAAIIFVFPGYFTLARSKYQVALYAFWYSLAAVLSVLSVLCIPFIDSTRPTAVDYYALFLITLLTAFPYVFAGLVVTLLVVRFPSQSGGLFAALLMGAGAGGLVAWGVGRFLDAPTAVLAGALLGIVAVLCFLTEGYSRVLPKVTAFLAVLLAIATFGNGFLSRQGNPFLRLRWVQGKIEDPPLYEKWSAFSRLQVRGDLDEEKVPTGKSLSPTFTPWLPIKSLSMSRDSNLPGVLFGGPSDSAAEGPKFEFLRFELENLAYHIRTVTDTLILGAHDGHATAAALAFGATSLVVLEPDTDVLDTVHNRYGELTGHLDQDPRIGYSSSNLLGFLAESTQSFDLIQISSPRRWTAHTLGVLLHEAQLYLTVEVWCELIRHLDGNGMLSVSIPYSESYPWEAFRTLSLAVSSLEKLGISNPAEHLAMATYNPRDKGLGRAVLLLSRGPIVPGEMDRLDRTVRRFFFETPLRPGVAESPTLENLISGRPVSEYDANIPVHLAASTEDQPFFFSLARLRAWGESGEWAPEVRHYARRTPAIQLALLVLSGVLTLLLILIPPLLREEKPPIRQIAPLLGLFAVLGLGFGWIATVLLYRLMLCTGSVTTGGIVILSTLFLAGGLGAGAARRIDNPAYAGLGLFLILITLLVVESLYLSQLLDWLRPQTTGLRWTGILLLLGFQGVLLGPTVPMALKVALVREPTSAPWLISLAGAMAILGLVSGAYWAASGGLHAVLWAAAGGYTVSLGFFTWSCMTEGYSTIPPSGILHARDQPAIEVVARPVEEEV